MITDQGQTIGNKQIIRTAESLFLYVCYTHKPGKHIHFRLRMLANILENQVEANIYVCSRFADILETKTARRDRLIITRMALGMA